MARWKEQIDPTKSPAEVWAQLKKAGAAVSAPERREILDWTRLAVLNRIERSLAGLLEVGLLMASVFEDELEDGGADEETPAVGTRVEDVPEGGGK